MKLILDITHISKGKQKNSNNVFHYWFVTFPYVTSLSKYINTPTLTYSKNSNITQATNIGRNFMPFTSITDQMKIDRLIH